MEAVLFDCHYKKKCSSYGYSGEGNARTLGESHSLEHTHPQQMPTIFGTDAPRPPGIPDIVASSSVASLLPNLSPFTSSACKGRGKQPFPNPPLQPYLSKGMEQRCGGVSGHYRVQKKKFDATMGVSRAMLYHILTPSVCGADPGASGESMSCHPWS